uniref:Uncharacterized protein n=1 Tax=Brassica campestris TaxID=3711 RepID=A0A3P5YUG7_BRACM|nr:unnamed protein product [Brassica rapa]
MIMNQMQRILLSAPQSYPPVLGPMLRLQYCPLRIKKIQTFEEEHKHIFSQGT